MEEQRGCYGKRWEHRDMLVVPAAALAQLPAALVFVLCALPMCVCPMLLPLGAAGRGAVLAALCGVLLPACAAWCVLVLACGVLYTAGAVCFWPPALAAPAGVAAGAAAGALLLSGLGPVAVLALAVAFCACACALAWTAAACGGHAASWASLRRRVFGRLYSVRGWATRVPAVLRPLLP
jgi:hypothetical protein